MTDMKHKSYVQVKKNDAKLWQRGSKVKFVLLP